MVHDNPFAPTVRRPAIPRIDYPASGLALPTTQPGGVRTLNVERMLKHLQEPLFGAFAQLGKDVLFQGALDPCLRELALVRVGLLSNAPYEVYHHDALALKVGVSQEKLDALRAEQLSAVFTPIESAVLAFTDEVVKNVRPSDATLAGLQKFFSSSEIAELLVAIGVYMMVSRFLETFGVDFDEFTLDATLRQ